MNNNVEKSAGMLKIAVASALGATIEWYDFFLYGVMTALVFNKLFFPNFDPWIGIMLAYSTFMVGFISRPLGGLIFGHYGDRLGRNHRLRDYGARSIALAAAGLCGDRGGERGGAAGGGIIIDFRANAVHW